MKHIQKRFLLLTVVAASAFAPAYAQEPGEAISDSLVAGKQVQVAFRKMAQDDILGGVSTVDMEDLLKKNYNTYSLDNMQGYVGGWNGNSLWGMDNYLVLVDGVPRSASNVKADEVKSITFMKGAQAVILYGNHAAKGVVLITTKRGKTESIQIDVRANTGWNVAKSYPEYLGSAEYMTLYNEALCNDNNNSNNPNLKYTAEDIYNFGSGSNPYRYPNVDFYSSDYIKKAYNRTDVTAEISGGGERAQFYSNVSYYRVGSQFNFGEVEKSYTDRFNVRGNVDLHLNEAITAFVNANVTFYNEKGGIDADDVDGDDDGLGSKYWEAAATFRPNRVAPFIPISYVDPNALAALKLVNNSSNIIDGQYLLGGTKSSDETNVFADYTSAGESTTTARQFQFDAGVNIALDKVMQGLSFHTQFSVDYATSYVTSYNNNYATYDPTWSSYNGQDAIVALNKLGNDKKSGVQNISNSVDNQIMAFNAHFDYNRSFNLHNVSAILVGHGYQYNNSGQYHATSGANLGLQASYNYAQKYYLEAGVSAVHSARLAPNHREKLSTSVSLGWNLAKEDFMEGSAFDDLMVSVSGSQLQTDMGIDNYYLYASAYNQSNGAWWGWYDGQSIRSTNAQRSENLDLTFIKRREISANVRASLWNRKLTVDASFFTNKMVGNLDRLQNKYPSYFTTYYPEASFLPYMNYNDDKRTGFDIALNYNKKLGEVDFSAGISATYYEVKATKRDDGGYSDPYQYREGKDVDGIWGYECMGFFNSDDEITGAPDQSKLGGTVRPGDLRYKDQNGDDLIDAKDRVFLGRGGWYGDPLTMGINLTAKYKGVSLLVLGTAGFGGKALKNNSYWWVYGEGKYSAVVRGRWTAETAQTATYPRLTTQSGGNNFTESDFWLYKTDRFNLAKVQLTYDFPKAWLAKTFVKEASAYVSGANLLTVAKERDILEMNVGSAPQTRFYNLGVKVTF